jgi:hypothetical protein
MSTDRVWAFQMCLLLGEGGQAWQGHWLVGGFGCPGHLQNLTEELPRRCSLPFLHCSGLRQQKAGRISWSPFPHLLTCTPDFLSMTAMASNTQPKEKVVGGGGRRGLGRSWWDRPRLSQSVVIYQIYPIPSCMLTSL